MLRCKYLGYKIVLFLFAVVLSCNGAKDEIEPRETMNELSATPTTFSFEAEGGTEILTITSNAIWRINYDRSSWCRPSIQIAEGNASVIIKADLNELGEDRAATFTIAAKDVEDVVVTISQGAGETEQETEDYIDPDNTGMRNLTSVELTELMGLGWNLGNSMEAINVSNGSYTGNETSWGNPVVNQDLIDGVKAAGFNTVRIPVSWSHMLEGEETYKINYKWKLRVEEVVNHVLNNEMYAMINIHWDGGWMDHPTYENQEEINEKIEALWKQISIFFRDYDDHLLFAGTNEVHVENNYGIPTSENAEVQNSFNQTFVNTVRATGGKNTYRHLIVQSYNTNIEHAVNYMIIPEDDTEDKLMVEVHFYDPYQFTLEENGNVTLWGAENQGSDAHSGWGDEDWVDTVFGLMKTNFVDEGYGVILGEYGAHLLANLSGSELEEHIASRNYYLNYVTKAAKTNGLVPVYWDNGYTGHNGSGLFDRSTGAQEHADAIEAIVSAN